MEKLLEEEANPRWLRAKEARKEGQQTVDAEQPKKRVSEQEEERRHAECVSERRRDEDRTT